MSESKEVLVDEPQTGHPQVEQPPQQELTGAQLELHCMGQVYAWLKKLPSTTAQRRVAEWALEQNINEKEVERGRK